MKALKSLPESSEYKSYRADILFNLGKICKLHANNRQAIKYYKKSSEYANEEDLSSVYYNLANAYKKNNQPDSATHFYVKSLKEAYHAKDEIRQAKVYLQLGLVYKAMGDMDEARSRFLTIVNNDQNTTEAYARYRGKALHNLGDMQLQDGNYPEAIRYFEKAMAAKTKPADQFNTLLNLGLTYDALDDHHKAQSFYERAEAYYPTVDTYIEYIDLFRYMDFSYRKSQNHELSQAAASRYYEEIARFNATKQAQIDQYQAQRINDSLADYDSWISYQQTIRQ
ncbi:MAG: tetratricopeptide repeat protein, partial [Bacteroidota bacterium]